MSLEKMLNLVEAKRPSTPNPIVSRRVRLSQHIDEQIGLVEDARAGRIKPFTRLGPEDGQEGRKRTTPPWWWMDQGGAFYLCLRYARQPVELAKGKTAVKCTSLEEVANTLVAFKTETLKGTFDASMATIAKTVRKGFGAQVS